MEHEKIATVTVTFNRKELLLQNIQAILNQNYDIDKIIIIDNHSTDNTKEAVEKQFPTDKIEYIYLEENTGGAGGFYTGCKYAYDNGFDWIVLMDDDGRPKNNDTIKKLMEATKVRKLRCSDKVLFNSLVLRDDENLTFELLEGKTTLEDIRKSTVEGIIVNAINPFNGTLVSKGLINEIGFPNKDFFITCDEQDYNLRAVSAKANVATVVDSLYYHPSNKAPNAKVIKIFGRKMRVAIGSPAKTYYITRNKTYMYQNANKEKWARKYLIKRLIAIFAVKCDKIENIKMLIKGYRDGKKGRLGKTVEPR